MSLQMKREIFEWRWLLKHVAFMKKKEILFILLINVEMLWKKPPE